MKVLLIYPEYCTSGYKPIGLSILGGLITGLGHEVDLFDSSMYNQSSILDDNGRHKMNTTFLNWFPVPKERYEKPSSITDVDVREALDQRLAEFNPDVLMVSTGYEAFSLGRTLIRQTDARNTLAIYGGIHCTSAPELALAPDDVKYIHVGEAERSIKPLLEAIGAGAPIEDCDNIWTRNPDGTIRKNPLAPMITDMDQLPFYYWDFFQEYHYYRIYQGHVRRIGDFATSRGCVNSCTYCFNRHFFEQYQTPKIIRRYTVDRAIEELVRMRDKYGIDFIKFHDSDFMNMSTKYLEEFSIKYNKHVGLPNTANACVGHLSEKKSRSLVRMNTRSLTIGFEIGNKEMRRDLLQRQNYTNEFFIEQVKKLRGMGIRTPLTAMLGFPGETREQIMETIREAKKSTADHADFGLFFPFPNLWLTNYAIEKGYLDKDVDLEAYAFGVESPIRHVMSPEQLKRLLRCCALYMKLPYLLWPFIRQAEKNPYGPLWKFLRKLFFFQLQIFPMAAWLREKRRLKTRNALLAADSARAVDEPDRTSAQEDSK